MRSFRRIAVGTILLAIAAALQPSGFGQSNAPLTIRVTTREAIVEVIARDKHGNPVSDLTRSEFQVFELGKKPKKLPQRIVAVNLIDPSAEHLTDAPSEGFRVTTGGKCAVATTSHYEIVFSASQRAGYHNILITTGRPQVTLSYRRRYYVGEAAVNHKQEAYSPAKVETILQEAACYHASVPSSISLAAHLIQMGDADSTRYSLLIRADSLGFIDISDEAKRVQLDYGVCTFDSSGMPLKYMHTSMERVLSSEEFERAMVHGLPNLLDMPNTGAPAYARFIVRDRATGNLGSVDVVNPLAVADIATTHKHVKPPVGSIRAFGSVVPEADSFCGDVYELDATTSGLPDFWNMDPIGSIYTNALDVPDQNIVEETGIPGVTSRVAWFGVDYYGEFWISSPGEYKFTLTSDDGAQLFIDGQLLIDTDGVHPAHKRSGQITLAKGRHVMRIPYFQGPPTELALVLKVEPPGGKSQIFDLRDYRSGAK